MAIIYSYPLNDNIKPLDELVGTTEKNINGQLKTVTRNFLLQDLAEFLIIDGGLQKTIILTTDGNSGPSTLDQVTGILNIPQYSGGGSQDLQSVTDIGATTTNGITITVGDGEGDGVSSFSSQGYGIKGESNETYGVYGNSISATGVYGNSDNGYGVEGYSEAGVAVYGASQDNIGVKGNSVLGTAISAYSEYGTGLFAASEIGVGVSATSNSIGLEVNGNGTIAIEANLGNSNKGVVINSGTSSTGNPIVVNKNGVDKLVVNQQGELTATKLIKQGGTSAQLLAANGDSITAGANITISGGTISSTGGGGSQDLQSVTDEGETTTNNIQFIDSAEVVFGAGGGILLDNTSRLREGTIDAGLGGSKGIAQICGVGYELKWEAGRLYVMNGNGNGIRESLYNFNILPTVDDDNTKAYYQGSLWSLDNGDVYECSDATTGAAVWYLKNTGSTPNLQQVTDEGASTTTGITITVLNDDALNAGSETGVAVYGYSNNNIGILGESSNGVAVYGYSNNGIGGEFISNNNEKGIRVTANDDTVAEFNQSLSNKGLIINSGTSSTGNFIELAKNGINKLTVNQAGELTAQKLIKDGGTSSQILAADGSVITAGTNITITGGQISSVGGAGGGGSSVNYYLNGGTSQGTFGGSTYYEFSKTAVIGTGADFSRSSNGLIASFITDVADPSLLLIPAGNWNLEFFFNSSSAGGSPSFYVELYKYDGTTFTSIASSSATPEGITNGTSIDAYFTPLAVPETVLTVNDRLAIRVFVNASSKTITLHTQNGHLCEVITTFTAGLTALNGLQAQVQNFATGTTGTDFDIISSGSTHTFNLPSASATARGVVTTASQTFAGDKTFTGAIGASNLSGTNTGDNATNTQYSGLATSKQDTLQSTINIKSINGNSILGSGDLTISGTGISSLNGLTGATQTFSATTNTGTGIPAWSSSGTNHQLNIPIAGGATTTGLITGTSQSISGSKTFLSNPEIPVPAVNTATCIVLGAAGGGGATGALQIGSTDLYPTALEMQYVKGITSSVQTQLDGKQPTLTAGNGINITSNTISAVDTSRAAYTMLANNTNASAIPTAQVYKDIAEQTYSLSPTFTITAPTTIVANTYKWSQVGSSVNVRVNLSYTTAGSFTTVVIPLPADMPTPLSPTGFTAASDILYYGTGSFTTTTSNPANLARVTFLRRNAANNGYEFVMLYSAAIAARVVTLTLQYFT